MAQLLKSYKPSATTGFLEFVPRSFVDPYYKAWDDLAANLSSLLSQKQLRKAVEALTVLSTDRLQAQPEWRRGHSLLSFLLQAYIWEDRDNHPEQIPAAIALPFASLSEKLGVPFTQSYADLVLWNWTAKDGCCPPMELDSLTTLFSFTGTKDEEWFHLTSIAIEAKGSTLIPHLLRTLQAVEEDDVDTAAEEVLACSLVLVELRGIMRRITEHCSPTAFYYQLSPYLAGSNALEHGVRYENSDGQGSIRLAGGSNAMTSLIPFCDMVLGVEHDAKTQAFFDEMRIYMPTPHRTFLRHMQSKRNVAKLAQTSGSERLRSACKNCVETLRQLRSFHIQIATQYLIIPGRRRGAGGAIHGNASESPLPLLQRIRNSTG